jgi:hypothetical protein
MTSPEMDQRSPSRRARDEQIGAEAQSPPLELCAHAPTSSIEDELARHHRRRVEQLLDHPDEQFRQAADYVLKKNAELYRRLA